ncbi:MAG: aminotransferase class V-fold PLP-dependent enzyme [Armatimonadetes bacterium]|nr:aminotransferase class V-fold PLP-dependent enzyme [Armatimonadota bacterium]
MLKLLQTIDQLARRSRTFREMQDEVVRLLRTVPHYNWIGIYMVEGGDLVLGGWDGPAPTEHVRIPIGQGICGAAASSGETVLVDDVAADPRYLQCFINTRAEIVVPISWGGEVIGEIDIDSDRPAAFNDSDRAFLEDVAKLLAARWAGEQPCGPSTRAVAELLPPEMGARPVGTPMYGAVTYEFEDMQALEDYLGRQDLGYIYTRWANPTICAAERNLAAVEGSEDAALFASGMAAIATTLLSLLKTGDEVVAPHNLYGGSYHLLEDLLPRYGIEVRFVDVEDLPRVVLRDNTRVVYFEPVTNPTVRVVDVDAVVKACRKRDGITVVVDNTVASPVNLRPHEHGVDLVIHSATKYLGGHSDLLCGVVSGAHDRVQPVRVHGRYLGGAFNPREAMLLMRGLKTLPMRVERQCASAARVARFLSERAEIRRVWHPSLASHPEHDLAGRLLKVGCALLAFDVEDLATARAVVDRLTLFRRAASLGGVESLVSIPQMTSHWNVPAEGLARAGITPGTIRLSVGVEDVADLIADLDRALRAARKAATVG